MKSFSLLLLFIVTILSFTGCSNDNNINKIQIEGIAGEQTVDIREVGTNNNKNENPKPMEEQSNNIDTSSFNSCIQNTVDGPECKDCCDCLSGADEQTRTSCRDNCAINDFSTNTDFINVSVSSILGENGNYSQCTDLEDSHSCKSCCESSDSGMELQCGDFRFCRTACNNVFGAPKDDKIKK